MVRSLMLFALLFVAGCGGSEPPTVTLMTEKGVPYRVMITTFHDGAYADQPFHLLLKADHSAGEPKNVLQAGQCKNVSVGQTTEILYVFYDELAVSAFASFQYQANEPRVLLCDLHTPECRRIRQRLVGSGTKLSNICSYHTGERS